LGVLLIDDGRQVPLNGDIVLGSRPLSGAPYETAVVVTGEDVGAAHVRITVRDWQVTATDLGTGATHLCVPGRTTWSALLPGTPVALAPGAVLALGGRQVRFGSHRVLQSPDTTAAA
jgi:hypothetical protein